MNDWIETGKIVNTHGIRGDVKIEPWCDRPQDLLTYKRLRIGGKEYQAEHMSVQKNHVLAKLAGIDSVNDAMALRELTVSIPREDIVLEEGQYLIQDMLGCRVYDLRQSREIGTLKEILDMPAGQLYVVSAQQREHMIPGNPVFLRGYDPQQRLLTVETIKGMADDE